MFSFFTKLLGLASAALAVFAVFSFLNRKNHSDYVEIYSDDADLF